MKPSCQACAGTAMRRRVASAVAGTAVAGTMCGDSHSGHGVSHVQRRQGQPCASGRRGSNERGHGGSHVPVAGTASRCRTATTARPRRVGPAPVAAAARARRYGSRCAAACAKWLWIAVRWRDGRRVAADCGAAARRTTSCVSSLDSVWCAACLGVGGVRAVSREAPVVGEAAQRGDAGPSGHPTVVGRSLVEIEGTMRYGCRAGPVSRGPAGRPPNVRMMSDEGPAQANPAME